MCITLKRFKFKDNCATKLDHTIKFPMTLYLSQHTINNDLELSNIPEYQLSGFVEHYGSPQGGHYASICHNPGDDKWYKFNDTSVSRIDTLSNVESYINGNNNGYILFYTKNKRSM